MGIWKNRDKRKALKRRYQHEVEHNEPHFHKVETEEDKELRKLIGEIENEKE